MFFKMWIVIFQKTTQPSPLCLPSHENCQGSPAGTDTTDDAQCQSPTTLAQHGRLAEAITRVRLPWREHKASRRPSPPSTLLRTRQLHSAGNRAGTALAGARSEGPRCCTHSTRIYRARTQTSEGPQAKIPCSGSHSQRAFPTGHLCSDLCWDTEGMDTLKANTGHREGGHVTAGPTAI